MLRWYHEGLNALISTCPSGHSILSRLKPALWQALEEPGEDPEAFSALLQTTQRLYRETSESLQRGRDLLLEINSCREPAATLLKRAIREQQDSQRLPEYLELMFAAYGVESESIVAVGGRPTSFAQDADGEVYVLTREGAFRQLVAD